MLAVPTLVQVDAVTNLSILYLHIYVYAAIGVGTEAAQKICGSATLNNTALLSLYYFQAYYLYPYRYW
jgi:hypothetical protein